MSSPNIINVANVTESTMTRLTRDGRRLSYEMKVLQQPLRARACGSGAKSSADRRPVDPPPVVELKVYQLDGERKIDRTFTHEANFILYTTLETARPIAQPRGNGSGVAPPGPVLTGAAVAGAAYLDRPSPAAYFIFPDLSVRHEGFYRLSFNLFEELKSAHDADAVESSNPSTAVALRSPGMANVRHVHFRLEVKSEPFQVFSAKKFPGLAESTPLSRAVADQGCRVRIRRDVRMRRRETKHSNDEYAVTDDFSQGTPKAHPPKPPSERGRSMSNTTNESPAYNLAERRSSQDLYYQPTFPSHAEAHGSAANSPTSNTYGTPGQQHAAAPMPSTAHYMPPAAAAAAAAYSFHTYQPKGYDIPPTYSPTAYDMEPRSSFDCPRGPHSASGSSSHMPLSSSYSSLESKHSSTTSLHSLHSQHSLHSHTSCHSIPRPRSVDSTGLGDAQVLPPLKSAPFTDAHAWQQQQQQQQHQQQQHQQQHQLQQQHHQQQQQPYSTLTYQVNVAIPPPADLSSSPIALPSPIDPSTPPPLPTPAASSTRERAIMIGKRVHGDVFDTSSLAHPAWGGQRPDLATHGIDMPQVTLEDGSLADLREQANIVMEYKRADGTRQLKKCPAAA